MSGIGDNYRLQDSMQRMSLTTDYANFISYVAQRRNEYMEQLVMTAPSDTTEIAKIQGRIQGLDEVIRVRKDAADAKATRTR